MKIKPHGLLVVLVCQGGQADIISLPLHICILPTAWLKANAPPWYSTQQH